MSYQHRSSNYGGLFWTVAAVASPMQAALGGRAVGAGLTRWCRSAVEVVLLWEERSRQRRQLMGMDDRMLKDVAISRANVWAEASKPFWQA